jgi:hypothetical protein
MIKSLSALLLSDVIYVRGANGYELDEKNEFIPSNKINDVLDRIVTSISDSWKKLAQRKPFLSQCHIQFDYIALKQVLVKYSRDAFGQKRLLTLLKKVPNYEAHRNNMEVFGIKINSFNPYIHRRVGCFLYWCSILKPFHIDPANITIPEEDQYIVDYFNEITSYNLIRIMLSSCSTWQYCFFSECEHRKKGLTEADCHLTTNINDDDKFFRDFLYDVHYHSLSRSSFELFMSRLCILPYCRKGTCPLTTKFSLQEQNFLFIDDFEDVPSV